jgi:hypothetical protein
MRFLVPDAVAAAHGLRLRLPARGILLRRIAVPLLLGSLVRVVRARACVLLLDVGPRLGLDLVPEGGDGGVGLVLMGVERLRVVQVVGGVDRGALVRERVLVLFRFGAEAYIASVRKTEARD